MRQYEFRSAAAGFAFSCHKLRVHVCFVFASHKCIFDYQGTVANFDAFGDKDIKAAKVPPDALVQMAIQLAYYRCGVCILALFHLSSFLELTIYYGGFIPQALWWLIGGWMPL
jgi:hypothetical protein